MDRSIALSLGAALAFSMSGAYADEPAAKAASTEPALEEVVVTAERRSENLQNVPVTVTAVSSEQLLAANITNVQQLANLVPALSVVDPTGYNMAFIRGIGSSTLGGGTFASVATYIDGVYIARTTNAMFELDSVDSIQVLAGPQGSLYGRNATAGAIVITSKKPKPGDPLSGNVSGSFGSYGRREFSGALSSGLGDRAAISFTVAKHDRNGFVKNLNPSGSLDNEDMDNRDAISGSATLVFNPTDRMSFMLRSAYAKSNDRSGGGYEAVGQNVLGPFNGFGHNLNDNRSVFYAVASGAFAAFGPALADQISTEFANSVVFSNTIGSSYDNQRDAFTNNAIQGTHKAGSSLYIDNTLLVLNGTFDFDDFTLKSSTGYTDSDYHGSVQVGLERPGSARSATLGAILLPPGSGPYVLDAAGGLGFSSINPSKVFSQGLQLLSSESSRIKWIAGVDYSKEKARVVQTGDGFGASNVGTNDRFTVKSSALFAQATIPFSSSWSGTLGGRYTDESYDLIDIRPAPNPPDTLKGKKFTYTARVQRQADDWLVFGGVTSGFKTGTLNAASAGAGRALPEEVTTAEIGFKRDFVPNFRFNSSIYYSTYKNVQLNIIDQRTGGNILDNGPKAAVKGIDLQAIAKINKNFQLSLGATLLDAKFTENNVNLPNIKGNTLPGSAKLAVSLVGDYNFPLAGGAGIDLSVTGTHNSGKFYDHLNLVGSGGSTDKAYNLVNLNLAYKSANQRYTFSIWGNNVFDEKYYRTGIVAFGTFGREAIAGNPANFGATVKVSF
jgi:outer membrane receptor protein involved in Fe transport